jgi:4'-phosphopantetheinyl transferase
MFSTTLRTTFPIAIWLIDPAEIPLNVPRDPDGELVQRESLVGELLCRAAISQAAGIAPRAIRFERSKFGKPKLAAPAEARGIQFNLSHTRDLLACAVSAESEVGVDVEWIDPAIEIEAIGRHFLHEFDRQQLASVPVDRRIECFHQIWVLKEAYLKAHGVGLSRDPAGFSIPEPDEAGLTRLDNVALLLHRPTPAHVAALAVQCDDGRTLAQGQWRRARWSSQAGITVEG